ncbi:big defensin-like [Mya arenaria]|uniref:big defensin-like n=1 Tax=Mya arenaria TaxID=6604 RepID=UPI0022E79738|nr:big defensin-like [Mya arenaria]
MTANVKLNNAAPVVVVPIAVYAGAAVSPWVWAALVAVYGAATLAVYRVTRTSSDNHSCGGNRGYCRWSCRSNEYVNEYHSAVCGNYKCCFVR